MAVTDPHSGETLTEHPSSEDLAAYLSDALPPAGCALVEEHLAECRECRQEVVSARRLLRQQRPAHRRRWLVPAAAAAVLALVVLTRAPGPRPIHEEPLRSEKGGGGELPTTIGILSPADGDTVPSGPLVFAWQSQPDRPLYRLSLAEGSGREVWTGETTDTTLTIPATVSLDRGRTYFWTVDALSADGRSLTTKSHRFVIRP